ncbi:phosphoethanolamine transferase [Jejuia pallidilutea]|nr:phosphoethanolamine transferase [Jejuia pallidilutea]
MKKFENYGKENPLGKFEDVKYLGNNQGKQLYVIVVGESTNRKHFSLYNNYHRNTTPLLSEIKDELHLFTDVISPHTYTIGSLSKALTLGNYENPEGKYQGTIIQLFNQANFKTYWVSSQRPIGMMDTHVMKIGTSAQNFMFLNTKHTSRRTPYDINLVDKLKDIVKEDGDKKVVFLHMLGTHMNYKRRYPNEFEVFTDTPRTKFKRAKAYEAINAYDNAVRYNDYVLREIIETVRNSRLNGYVLYFSDHGQEVFDKMDFQGHTIDEETTTNMYEIPMFLWKTNYDDSTYFDGFQLNRKYMIDDLIHSIADISKIKSKQIDTTRSIFNEAFKERERIVKDTINFDTYFFRE